MACHRLEMVGAAALRISAFSLANAISIGLREAVPVEELPDARDPDAQASLHGLGRRVDVEAEAPLPTPKRRCQRHTAGRLTPASRATSSADRRSVESSTVRRKLILEAQAASVQDLDGAPIALRLSRRSLPFVSKACADSGYAGGHHATARSNDVEIVRKPRIRLALPFIEGRGTLRGSLPGSAATDVSERRRRSLRNNPPQCHIHPDPRQAPRRPRDSLDGLYKATESGAGPSRVPFLLDKMQSIYCKRYPAKVFRLFPQPAS